MSHAEPENSGVLLGGIPSFPVRNVPSSTTFYRDLLGFSVIHEETNFAILQRDHAELHIWEAYDEGWRNRGAIPPVVTGAESFIAGTASCRFRVEGIASLYSDLRPLGVVHVNGELQTQPWGNIEFAIVDPDNNLITFFERIQRS